MKTITSLAVSDVSILRVLSSLLCVAVLGVSIEVGAQEFVKIEGAEPVVPPLEGVFAKDVFFGEGIQQLDGLSCTNCTFKNMVLTYAGGAFRLENPTFENVSITLKGAAHNTLMLQEFIKVLTSKKPKVRPDPKSNPKLPIAHTLTRIDLISPDIGK